jgi:hypothetical protein
MNWFKKWFRNQCIDAWNQQHSDDHEPESSRKSVRTQRGMAIANHTVGSRSGPDGPSINFQIYPATGGYVTEISYYDESKDKRYSALHVIPNSDINDLGEALSKIITIEMIKR